MRGRTEEDGKGVGDFSFGADDEDMLVAGGGYESCVSQGVLLIDVGATVMDRG